MPVLYQTGCKQRVWLNVSENLKFSSIFSSRVLKTKGNINVSLMLEFARVVFQRVLSNGQGSSR